MARRWPFPNPQSAFARALGFSSEFISLLEADKRIPWISRNFLDLDRSPISPTRSPIDDKAQVQTFGVIADFLKKVAGIEKVSAGAPAEKRRELAHRQLMYVKYGNPGHRERAERPGIKT